MKTIRLLTALSGLGLTLVAGCFESDSLRGIAEADAGSGDTATAVDTATLDASPDAAPGEDTNAADVPQTPDATPSGALGGLVGSGSVAASETYRMVSTLGAPLTQPMEGVSTNYRMTTSLLSFSEATP